MEMQLTGQTAEQRKQATHRSSPSGSRVRIILARDRAGKGRLYSGYSSVIFLRKRCLRVVAMPWASPLIAASVSPIYVVFVDKMAHSAIF